MNANLPSQLGCLAAFSTGHHVPARTETGLEIARYLIFFSWPLEASLMLLDLSEGGSSAKGIQTQVQIVVLPALKVFSEAKSAFLLSGTRRLSAWLCTGVSMCARCSTEENQVPSRPRKTENCFACNREAFYFPHPQPAFYHLTSYR